MSNSEWQMEKGNNDQKRGGTGEESGEKVHFPTKIFMEELRKRGHFDETK